jgi:hypothetical protein
VLRYASTIESRKMSDASRSCAFGLLALGYAFMAEAQSLPDPVRAVERITTQVGEAGATGAGRVSQVFPRTRVAAAPTESSPPSLALPPSNGRTASLKTQNGVAQTGITYICDPTINNVAGLCNTLNSTIAVLYTGVFSDVNATIYVQFGSTGLGQSDFPAALYAYTDYRNALQADQKQHV